MFVFFRYFYQLEFLIAKALGWSQPLVLLVARLYVSWVFFKAGLTKIKDWDTTLFLFQEEYSVPLITPEIAAVLGTVGELAFPVLLSLGILSRSAALGLFVVNAVAVISLESIAPAAMSQHIFWGSITGFIAVFGPGRFALDLVIRRKL